VAQPLSVFGTVFTIYLGIGLPCPIDKSLTLGVFPETRVA